MTSAATAPELRDYQDDDQNWVRVTGFSDATEQRAPEYSIEIANNGLPVSLLFRRCVFRFCPGTADYKPKFTPYGEDSEAFIFVDFGEPDVDFPVDHQEAVRFLRANGRPIVADKVVSMLEDVTEDPDAPQPSIVSLRDLARFFVENQDFSDPFIGPDSREIVHAQWRFIGNGVLVISFLGYGEILLVAQADESPVSGALDVTKRGAKREILKEFGYLVPRRF